MKFLKTYEKWGEIKNYTKNYKKGDYVLVYDQSRPNCYVRIVDDTSNYYMASDYNYNGKN